MENDLNCIIYKAGDLNIFLKPDTTFSVDLGKLSIDIDGMKIYATSEDEILFLLEEFLYVLDEIYGYEYRASLDKKDANYKEIIKFMKKQKQTKETK